MSLTKVSYSMIQGAMANVLDFGADPTGVADSTAAFIAAQVSHKCVYAPQGSYLLDGLRIQTGVTLVGDGYDATVFYQKTNDNPAINCLSDVTTGQLLSLNLSSFGVIGKTGATVAAVVVAAYGTYAVFKSNFDFTVNGGFRSLEVQGADAANVFYCAFKVVGVNTTSTTVLINGSAYSTFEFFLSQNQSGVALDESAGTSQFIRVVTEGQLLLRGSGNIYHSPTVELIVGAALPAGSSVMQCTGSNQTLLSPYIVLDAASSAKATYALQPFTNTIFSKPRILATSALVNPFATAFEQKWSLIGPGQNSCPNKIESIYLDTNDAAKNLRTVSFIGDCSAFVSGNLPGAGKVIQYLAPTTTFNFTVKNNTSAVIWEPTGTISACFLTLPQFPVNNQVLSFSSTQTVTTITVNTTLPSGVNVSLVPTTITANTSFSIIYYDTNNKWYKI